MQLELIAFGRGLQVARQRPARAGAAVHLALILADGAALLALAAVHRELGVAQQLVALGSIDWEYREADRRGEGDRLALNGEWLGEGLRDPAGEGVGVVRMIT